MFHIVGLQREEKMIAYITAGAGGICLTLGSLAFFSGFFSSAAGWLILSIILVILACLKTKKSVEKKNDSL